MRVPTIGALGILPTPRQMNDAADECVALYTSIETWANRPYVELSELVGALAILDVADHARALERALRAAAITLRNEGAGDAV